MLLAHVESFLEIVRAGSLTRAAETLFVTQPTLTDRLKSLERELGKPLFFRTRRYGLQLTPAGEAFLPHAQQIAEFAKDAAAAVARAGEDAPAGLVLAVGSIVGTAVLGPALKRYHAANRRMTLDVRIGRPGDIVKMVLDRSVDVGLGRLERHAQIEISPLYNEELVVVVAPGHPLAQRTSAQLSDLRDESLIVVAKTMNHGHVARLIAKGSGRPPRPAMQVDSVEVARCLVERGVGVAFLPLGSAFDDLRRLRLRRLAIRDMAPIRAHVVSLRRFDSPPEPKSLQDFITFLREAGAALEGSNIIDEEVNATGPTVTEGAARSR